MMLTGRKRAMPLTFFKPRIRSEKTSPQAYVKEAVKRQQELNELCRRNTAQAQMRQRKKYDENILQAKPYAMGTGSSRMLYLPKVQRNYSRNGEDRLSKRKCTSKDGFTA